MRAPVLARSISRDDRLRDGCGPSFAPGSAAMRDPRAVLNAARGRGWAGGARGNRCPECAVPARPMAGAENAR